MEIKISNKGGDKLCYNAYLFQVKRIPILHLLNIT